MSQHPTPLYRGSLYYHPTTTTCPALRPVSSAEGTIGRLSHSPPPMHECPTSAIYNAGASSGTNGCEGRVHCMQPYNYSLSPFHEQWTYLDGRASTGGCSPLHRCYGGQIGCHPGSYDATHYAESMELPPLNIEAGGFRRASPQSFDGDDYDSMSLDESSDGGGLPEVLNKFKLIRPYTPGSQSDISRSSSRSPELTPTALLHQKRRTSSCRATPLSPGPITRDTASDRRKAARQARRSSSPVVPDPVHTVALEKALGDTPLVDVTVAQLRTLIKKLPVPPHLDGKWEEYAVYQPSSSPNNKKDHRCTFGKCKYTGKKQLVQRHIEGVHLKMKQYHCPYCPAAFHQETCAITHISSIHLKVFPFRCKYDCGKRFNDVARRHRHCQDVHGYVSKQTRRSPKTRKTQAAAESDSV